MKRVVIGGFFLLTGSLWTLSVSLYALICPVSQWATPPGRFLTTLFSAPLAPFFLFGTALVICALIILIGEYFKNDR